MSSNFRKFMNPYRLNSMLVTVASVGLLGYFLGLMVRQHQFSPIPLVVAAVCVAVSVRPYFAGRDFFRSLETQNSNAVDQDFARAIPFARGNVRMGQNHIFRKGSAMLVAYSDIGMVFPYSRKFLGKETHRDLMVADKYGRSFVLCRLGKDDAEMNDMIKLIRQKNPDVQLR